MSPASSPSLTWTPEAATRLENWLADRVSAAAMEGALASEVADDLRAHVHEELTRRGAVLVDDASLGEVLASIDGPRPTTPRPLWLPRREKAPPKPGFRWRRTFLFFAVIWPALTLLAEWAFGLCANEFFDPLPTVFHVALVALVPACLFGVYRTVQREEKARVPWAAAAAGFVLPITAYYTLAFGGLLAVALISSVMCVAIPWLLPLPWMTLAAPLAGFAALAGLRRLRRLAPCLRGWWLGLGVGLAVLATVELPRWFVFDAMQQGASSDPEEQAAAVESLRALPGAEEMLHYACFGDGRNRGGSIDLTSWLLTRTDGWRGMAPDPRLTMAQARGLFYRVTGKAFTEVPPRRARRFFALEQRLGVGRAARTDWVWDGERGGESVGARLPGLQVATSRMEWNVEGASRFGYGEWTLEFSNDHSNPQEARAQIKLPPGGCLSRLTLWVNGQAQEAAFAGQSQVRAAYQKVVTVERKDPVLVTQVGPDLVMMQCFPVPAKGGKIKVRLGITTPLDAMGRLWLPQFVERNFSVPGATKHVLWVQSRSPFDASLQSTVEKGANGEQTWQKDVPDAALGRALFQWRAAETAPVWCEDPLAAAGEGRFVTATWQMSSPQPLGAAAVLIDGSAALRPLRRALAAALQARTERTAITAWITTDREPRQLDLTQPDADLHDSDFVGGRDAVAGLRAALSAARGADGGSAVVWIHGPQPAELAQADALEQTLHFTLRHVPVYDVPLIAGPHRLAEKIYRQTDVRGAPRFVDVEADLPVFFRLLLDGLPELHPAFTRHMDAPSSGTKSSDQLSRYAAFADTLAAFQRNAAVDAATIASAARHQVVTPVTGAVVLETRQQFTENGLTQVDPSSTPSVPTIPEPGSLLLLLSASALALRRRR